MENIVVVLDDPEYALKMLSPMKNAGQPAQWLLVVCPPKLTRHIGRWVNHAARETWRKRWAQELVQHVKPVLSEGGDRVQWRLAERGLSEQTRQLQIELGTGRVLDARRPKFAQDQTPVAAGQPTEHSSTWTVPGGAAAMGLALWLAAD